MTNLTSLSHAMAYEWTRIRTTRLAWYLAAVAVIATAVAAWAYSAIAMRVAGSTPVDPREAVTFVISRPSFAPVVAGLLGVVAIGSDYRYGTMRTTLLVTPRRGIALGAKALVAGGVGAGLALLNLLVAWAVAVKALDGRVTLSVGPLDVVQLVAAETALAAGWALFGLFVAVLVRTQLIAVGLILTVPFIFEGMVRSMGLLTGQGWLQHIGGYLPFTAGTAMTDLSNRAGGVLLASNGDRAGPLLGTVIFVSTIAMLGLLGQSHFRRQDVL
jgi:ABC-2 type transport system permease protein